MARVKVQDDGRLSASGARSDEGRRSRMGRSSAAAPKRTSQESGEEGFVFAQGEEGYHYWRIEHSACAYVYVYACVCRRRLAGVWARAH